MKSEMHGNKIIWQSKHFDEAGFFVELGYSDRQMVQGVSIQEKPITKTNKSVQ